MINLTFEIPVFIPQSDFFACCKIFRHGASGLTSPLKKLCCGFLSPLKIHPLVRVWTANLGSNGKHANHYTTKAIAVNVRMIVNYGAEITQYSVVQVSGVGWCLIFQVIYEYGEQWWNDTDRGKWRTRRRTCPSATFSTLNPTWTDPGMNSGLCGERPATNCLSHGMALFVIVTRLWVGELGFDSWWGLEFFSSLPCADWLEESKRKFSKDQSTFGNSVMSVLSLEVSEDWGYKRHTTWARTLHWLLSFFTTWKWYSCWWQRLILQPVLSDNRCSWLYRICTSFWLY
jgi:hypothetical protein